MAENSLKFNLSFLNLPDNHPHVVSFTGKAELNSLFSFAITALIRTDALAGVPIRDFFTAEAVLILPDEGEALQKNGKGEPQAFDAGWHGILTRFETAPRAGSTLS